jgi:hypothetical protein
MKIYGQLVGEITEYVLEESYENLPNSLPLLAKNIWHILYYQAEHHRAHHT